MTGKNLFPGLTSLLILQSQQIWSHNPNTYLVLKAVSHHWFSPPLSPKTGGWEPTCTLPAPHSAHSPRPRVLLLTFAHLSLHPSNLTVQSHPITTAPANTSLIHTPQGLSCLSEPHSLMLENFPKNNSKDSFQDLISPCYNVFNRNPSP